MQKGIKKTLWGLSETLTLGPYPWLWCPSLCFPSTSLCCCLSRTWELLVDLKKETFSPAPGKAPLQHSQPKAPLQHSQPNLTLLPSQEQGAATAFWPVSEEMSEVSSSPKGLDLCCQYHSQPLCFTQAGINHDTTNQRHRQQPPCLPR